MRYEIKRGDSSLCKVVSLEYQGDWMESRYVNVTVKSPVELDFAVGDYLEYRGERFEIKSAVGIKKVAIKETYGEAFQYSNVKLESIVDELSAVTFLNYTYTNGSNIGGSLVSEFSFHCVDVKDLVSRIGANMKRAYLQGLISSQWNFDVSALESAEIGKKDVTVDVSDITCMEALRKVYDEFGVGYTISKSARSVAVGVAGTDRDFSFGKGNGLRDIERTLNTDNPVITRLRVLGSEKNLPRHYYYNLGRDWRFESAFSASSVKNIKNVEGTLLGISFTLPYNLTPIGNRFKMKFDLSAMSDASSEGLDEPVETYVKVSYDTSTNQKRYQLLFGDVDKGEDNRSLALFISLYFAEKRYTLPVIVDKAQIATDTEGKYLCSSGAKTFYGEGNADLLCLKNLIPTKYYEYKNGVVSEKITYTSSGVFNTLDPFFDSANIAEIGIREGFVKFDSDDDENGIEEIYPTIENMDNAIKVGTSETKDGIFTNETKIPTVDVYVADWGFDLKDCQAEGSSNYGTLCMKSGMCGGREFEIVGCEKVESQSQYKLTLNRVEDSGLDVYFPNCNYQIAVGDTFVITGIEMPKDYVQSAGDALAVAAKAYLAKVDHPTYSYNVSIDNIFIAKDYDEEEDDSIYWNIKEGDTINLTDEDLIGKNADGSLKVINISIDKLVIKEQEGKIPQLSVTLRNEKKEKTLVKIASRVSSAVSVANSALKSAKKKISSVQVQNIAYEAAANVNSSSGSSSVGNSVQYTSSVTNGEKIGTLTIDGSGIDVKVPYTLFKTIKPQHLLVTEQSESLWTGTETLSVSKGQVVTLASTVDGAVMFIANTEDDSALWYGSARQKTWVADDDYEIEVGVSCASKVGLYVAVYEDDLGLLRGNLTTQNYADILNSVYLKLSGGSVTGNLNVGGDFIVGGASALGSLSTTSVNNSGTITTENLKVTGTASFFELIIDKIKSVGGSAMFTPADGFSIEAYEKVGNDYYLYWRASDGTNMADSKWEIGDQALCMNFNKHNSNTYWWALVTNKGRVSYKTDGVTPIDEKKNQYNYIVVSGSSGNFTGTLSPAVGDSVVMCGNRNDTSRQGVLYIAAYDGLDTGIHAPFIAQYRGVNDFNLAIHRKSYFDRDGAKFIGDFSVVSGGSEKTLEEYINNNIELSGRIIINGDDESEPTTDSAFIGSIITKIGDAQVSSIADLVGAIYINTQKMFWMLTYNDGVYSWEEDTDGTLAELYEGLVEQKERLDRITNDYCISEDEKLDMVMLLEDVVQKSSRAEDLMAKYDDSTAIQTAGENLQDVCSDQEEMISYIISKIPCYFSNATNKQSGKNVLTFTRQQFLNGQKLLQSKYEAFNDAVVNYTANNIGSSAAESAKQSAIEYVQENIDSILDESTKNMVEGWIASYGADNFAGKSEYTQTASSLSALTTWVGKDTIGGTGLITHLQTLFVGTNKISFDSDGKVVNINKSGLVTDSGFAALFAKEEDSRGVRSALAELGAYTQHVGLNSLPSDKVLIDSNTWYSASLGKYVYRSVTTDDKALGTYYYVKSNVSISADDVELESGSPKLGNYLKISNGNLWCQNLTVEGVYNNLINVVDVRNNINAGKLIDGFESGGISYKSIDILQLGDVISLQSTHNGSNNNSLVLPYYIDSTWNKRTLTKYGTGSTHSITRKELKQLIGRKVTIMVEDDSYMAQKLYGVFNLDYAGDVEDAVDMLTNGVSFVKKPTAEMGVSLTKGMVLHLEFRPMQFVDNSGVSTFGYAWVCVSNPSCSLDSDSNWND